MSSFDEPEVAGAKAPATPPPLQPPSSNEALTDQDWGRVGRMAVLFTLLGMAFTVTARFSFGHDWLLSFLKKNELGMLDRIWFIVQMVGVGVTLGVTSLVLVVLEKTRRVFTPQVLEAWAWFLSPLILLPAPFVVMQPQIWTEHHKDLLPLILFGGLLAEFFFSQALIHMPAPVARFLERLGKQPARGASEIEPAPTATSETHAESLTDERAPDAQAAAAIAPVPGRATALVTYFRANIPFLVVIAVALAYGAFMGFFTVRWHHKLGTAIFDLGINDNLMFGGLHGRINESAIIFPEDPAKYTANHIKWGMYALLPFYAVFPRAETLLIAQSICIGLGAIPLYLFCKDRLPKWWAAAIAICYLSYYPLQGANFCDMNPVPTGAAVMLSCIWAIDTRRYGLGAFFFLWTLIMREDMPIPMAVVGTVFLLSGRRPVAGLIITAVSASWFVYLRFYFMNEAGNWWFPNMYRDLWAAPERGFQGVIKTLVSNPSFTLKHIFVEKKFWYLMHLLVPVMFLPVRRWYGWAALVPGAILTLLVTDYAPPLMFSFQYVMHWTPYLFLASGLVLAAKLSEPHGRERALGALIAMCLSVAALCYNYGAFPLREKSFQSGYRRIGFTWNEADEERYRNLRALIKTIPGDATVAATEHIGAHLSSRLLFYTLRRDSHGVSYIVARKKELSLDKTRRTILRALESGEYGVESRFGEFVVFKKGADTKDNDSMILEWNLKKGGSSRPSRSSTKDATASSPTDKRGLRDSDGQDDPDHEDEAEGQEDAERQDDPGEPEDRAGRDDAPDEGAP